MNQEEKEAKVRGRRKFLDFCLTAMGTISAGVMAFPFVSYLRPAPSAEASGTVEVPIDTIPEDEAVEKSLQGEAIGIIKIGGKFAVFSLTCPHLGCNVRWEYEKQEFHCPCHGAVFSAEGKALKGPTKESLKKIPFKLDEAKGKVIVGEGAV